MNGLWITFCFCEAGKTVHHLGGIVPFLPIILVLHQHRLWAPSRIFPHLFVVEYVFAQCERHVATHAFVEHVMRCILAVVCVSYLSKGKLNAIEPFSRHEFATKTDHIIVFIVRCVVSHQVQVACETSRMLAVLDASDLMIKNRAQPIGPLRAALLGMIQVRARPC